MRIVADREQCEGHGVCVTQAPTLLDMDDDDIVIILEAGEDVPAPEQPNANVAVESCPVAALRLLSD